MKKTKFLLLGLASLFLFACSNQVRKVETTKASDHTPLKITPEVVTSITMNDSISTKLLLRGREIAIFTQRALKKELLKAINEGGTENAVSFCSSRAMEITDSVSIANNVEIRRLAKKNRNPENAMTENESNLFKSYVIDNLNKAYLRGQVSWNDLGQPVYYDAIPTETLCLTCHGTVGKEVTPQVAELIAALYPDDQALDFETTHLRGMWAITFPEYRVVKVDRSANRTPSN